MALDVPFVRNPASISALNVIYTGASVTSYTMANCNLATDWNQVIALYNRRSVQCMLTPVSQSNIAPGTITASNITAFRTKINNLRNIMLNGNYPWTTPTIVSGQKIRAIDLNDLYSAMNFGGTLTIGVSGTPLRMQQTDHLGFVVIAPAKTTASATTAQFFGKQGSGASTVRRARLGMAFPIPAGIASTVTATMHIAFASYLNSLETCDIDFYAGTTAIATTNGWYTSDISSLICSGVYGTTGDQAISLSYSALSPFGGSNMNCCIGQRLDLNSSGSQGASGVSSSFSWSTTSGVPTPNISFNFGF